MKLLLKCINKKYVEKYLKIRLKIESFALANNQFKMHPINPDSFLD